MGDVNKPNKLGDTPLHEVGWGFGATHGKLVCVLLGR